MKVEISIFILLQSITVHALLAKPCRRVQFRTNINTPKYLCKSWRGRKYFSVPDDHSNLEDGSKGSDESLGNKLWFDISTFSQKISLPNILVGSVVGAFVATATIFAPFIFEDSVESLPASERERIVRSIEQPVNLFQDILLDLQTGYVDPIDPTKLFETGVSAMLRSLDPYTEFENLDTAKSMQESVSGKYAGVGMVISGSKKGSNAPIGAPPAATTQQKQQQTTTHAADSNADADAGLKKDETTPPAVKETDTQSPVGSDKAVGGTKSSKKDAGNGVSVADVFEGYAYDAGMRVGDRILSVDSVDASKMTVEQVRDLLRGDPDTIVTVVFEREEKIPAALSSTGTGAAAAQRAAGAVPFSNTIKQQQPAAPAPAASQAAGQVGDEDAVDADIAAAVSSRILREVPAQGSNPGKVIREVKITRKLVRMSDVRLATFLGDPQDGIGYINLGGFNQGAGRDFRRAFLMLRYSAPEDLKGLVLDLRGNPGGILDVAVEISSYLVPAKSEIVSSKSRSSPEIVYRSTIEPIKPAGMKLAVLINGNSASASEIVSGAIQDLDAGVIVGPTRTYGKGLVQKITPLPYDSALKYTIAKYYTPSGRCIQRVTYSGGRDQIVAADNSPSSPITDLAVGDDGVFLEEGEDDGGLSSPILPRRSQDAEDGARVVSDKDRKTFFTAAGRPVRDGGGVEPDLKIDPIKAGPAESIFFTQGVYSDFAAQYLSAHEDVRPALRNIADAERRQRKEDGRFITALREGTLNQYLVLLEPIIGYDGKNTEKYAAPRNDELAPPVVASTSGSSLSALASASSVATVADSVTDVVDGSSSSSSSHSTLSSSSGSKKEGVIKSNDRKGSSGASILGSKVDDLFWVPIARTDTSADDSRQGRGGGQGGGGKSSSSSARRNKIYSEFRQYVEKRIENKQLDLEASLGSKLDKLEKDLKAEGLQSVVDGIEQVRPKIKEGIMADMDKNKDYIIDGVEQAILSRELPGRLLLFKNILKDPQVRVAAALVKGDDASVMKLLPSKDTPSGDTDKGGDKKQQKIQEINVVPGSSIYSTLLQPVSRNTDSGSSALIPLMAE